VDAFMSLVQSSFEEAQVVADDSVPMRMGVVSTTFSRAWCLSEHSPARIHDTTCARWLTQE